MVTGQPQAMRKLNKRIVYDLITKNKTVTRPEICAVTGLKPPTIKNIIESLISDEIIVCSGKGNSAPGGGPRPDIYMLNSKKWYFIGADISIFGVAAVIIDLRGDMVSELYAPVDESGSDKMVDVLCGIIHKMLKSAAIDSSQVAEICVSFAAFVDLQKQRISSSPHEIMYVFDIQQFRAMLGFGEHIKISLENDINAIAMGVMCISEEIRNDKHFVCVGIRNGVGVSVIIDGKVYRGHDGMVGAIGDLPLVYGEAPIINQINQVFYRRIIDKWDLFETMGKNDEVKSIVYECIRHLGKEIAEVVMLLNPDGVIFTGQILDMDVGLYEALVDSCEQHLQQEFSVVKGARPHPNYHQVKMDRFSLAYYSAIHVMNDFCSLIEI